MAFIFVTLGYPNYWYQASPKMQWQTYNAWVTFRVATNIPKIGQPRKALSKFVQPTSPRLGTEIILSLSPSLLNKWSPWATDGDGMIPGHSVGVGGVWIIVGCDFTQG